MRSCVKLGPVSARATWTRVMGAHYGFRPQSCVSSEKTINGKLMNRQHCFQRQQLVCVRAEHEGLTDPWKLIRNQLISSSKTKQVQTHSPYGGCRGEIVKCSNGVRNGASLIATSNTSVVTRR